MCICLCVCLFNFLTHFLWSNKDAKGTYGLLTTPQGKWNYLELDWSKKKNFWLGIMSTENVCLSVIDVCLSVTLNLLHTLILNTLHTLIQMFVCPSQFYFQKCQKIMPFCYRKGEQGEPKAPILRVELNFWEKWALEIEFSNKSSSSLIRYFK